MLLQVGIVFAAYGAVRLYETYASKKKKLLEGGRKAEADDINLPAVPDENQKNKHYLKMSAFTIGLAIIRNFYPPLTLATLAVFTYTAIPYIRQTETSLIKDRKIDGYVLYCLADMMMLWLGAYATASVGIGLLHLAKYILSNAKAESKKKVIDVFAHQPDKVWLLKEGVEVQVPLDVVEKDDIIVVNAGDIVPVDGTVTDGIASIDQHALTGESQPAEKKTGDEVFASTLVISGRICVRTERSGKETTVAKVVDVINNSIDFKSSLQLKGERWADTCNVPMLALGFATWPFLGPVGTVGVLESHIANTIRVVAPLSTLNYLNKSLDMGILVKDGRVLEDIKNVDTVLFDKTGTLTQDIPKLGRIILCDGQYSKDELLFYAATAERKSVHPIAKAILNEAKDSNMILPEIEDSKYQIGYGIEVRVDGKTIHIGSVRFMEMENISIGENIRKIMEEAYSAGHSVIMAAIDSKLRGVFEMHTTVRPEVKKIIACLREMGVKHIAIVSGDHEEPTKALARTLGIDAYYHDILPENKADIVEMLQKEGKKVAFVGDGVNDVIAMKKAEVSVSLSGATTIATDVAQVILMDGSLTHLADLFKISKNLDKNLLRSLMINIVPNAVTLCGVLFFHFGMLTAVLLSQSALVFGAVNAAIPFKKEQK